jgi:bifunctional non-homologous end joining protein LigD
MLATAGEIPEGAQWCYEFKWDGVRALLSIRSEAGGGIRIHSRSGGDITQAYPEVVTFARRLAGDVGSGELRLDGEIIAFGPDGRPSFSALQGRMAVNDAARARRLAGSTPVTFLAFDILAESSRDVMGLRYEQRRALLEALPIEAPPSLCAPDVTGADVAGIAREQGLEGVVAKRRDRPYEPGRRSANWIKKPFRRRQDVVVAGWEPGKHGRIGQLGALLVGVYEEDGALRYAGQVGSGFTDRTLADLQRRLAELACPQPAFASLDGMTKREIGDARWVRPELVAAVEFREWTPDGRLRAPSFKGLRSDIAPEAVVRDTE